MADNDKVGSGFSWNLEIDKAGAAVVRYERTKLREHGCSMDLR
jgi:hypothetical protein